MPIRHWLYTLLMAAATGSANPEVVVADTAPATRPAMKRYDGHRYRLDTDLPVEAAREVLVRLHAMAGEYERRTRSFAGGRAKPPVLPVHVFTDKQAYLRAGGVEGSAGFYTGRALVACTFGRPMSDLWMTLQHEGFHQYVHQVVGGRWPVWLNEGLAEYFAQGLWTGDGFVLGTIPPRRLRRVKKLIATNAPAKGSIEDFPQLMAADAEAWRQDVRTARYDQVWSMVYFLIHGDEGRYRGALGGFIEDLASGKLPGQGWRERFGTDHTAFRKRYEAFWRARGPHPTRHLYDQAMLATLASFLARAHLQGLRFDNADAFLAAARAGKIDITPRGYRALYLPPALLAGALQRLARTKGAKLTLTPFAGRSALKLVRTDGMTFQAVFTPRGEKPPEVTVTLTRP